MMPPLWGSRGGEKIMVDQGRARDVNEAAARFAETLADSYRLVYGQAAESSERQQQRAREFSELVSSNLSEQAEAGRANARQLSEQAARQRDAGQRLRPGPGGGPRGAGSSGRGAAARPRGSAPSRRPGSGMPANGSDGSRWRPTRSSSTTPSPATALAPSRLPRVPGRAPALSRRRPRGCLAPRPGGAGAAPRP